MKRKFKEPSIDWVFNFGDCKKAIECLGSKNLDLVEAIIIEPEKEETLIATYTPPKERGKTAVEDKMLRDWVNKVHNDNREYIYFRFKKNNK